MAKFLSISGFLLLVALILCASPQTRQPRRRANSKLLVTMVSPNAMQFDSLVSNLTIRAQTSFGEQSSSGI